MPTMTRFQKLTLATAAVTVVLFAVGGLVRGTGSGLGCSTWPLCTPGHLFPSGNIHSLIEFSHRIFVVCTTILVAVTAYFAWKDHRGDSSIVRAALIALPLVLAQAVVGGLLVNHELDPYWVTGHFVVALVFVADVIYLAVQSFRTERPGRQGSVDAALAGFSRLTMTIAAGTGLLLLAGTWVRVRDVTNGLAFTDWPLADGKLVPALGGVATPTFLHRVLSAVVSVLVVYAVIRARTMAPRQRQLVRLTTLTLALFLVQIMVGAAQVWTHLKPWAVVVHVGVSVLIWASVVTLAVIARGLSRHAEPAVLGEELRAADAGLPPLRDTLTAYYRLIKPRIIILLLITTVPAMILAGHRVPSIWLMLATLVGGTAAAGSANAINMYLDRDIDEIMQRTRSRPLPSQAVTPERALRFGFFLGALSFFFLAILVNTVAASLALSAIAFYVFVYTMWLKRSTAQNIVIGGAAGAAPALIGWAAVTGGLALPAWILFAIVFVWTPPHFWALAMRYEGDYAAAGVPMLPVVRGQDETRRQIFLYSLLLFAVTIALWPLGHMGTVYLVVAVGLGGVFCYKALILWRTPSPQRAWKLFGFSIVYLSALFGAVAVDAVLPVAPLR
ncbi:MAG: heme o synthase [Actinomycetota bacterium]|jgi:protoheme IX farnesyltransferase|nr:heme o synthase [Actinomycetota bacterium]